VSVLSLLYVVFIEFAGDDAGDESGRRVTLRESTFDHKDGMLLEVVTTFEGISHMESVSNTDFSSISGEV